MIGNLSGLVIRFRQEAVSGTQPCTMVSEAVESKKATAKLAKGESRVGYKVDVPWPTRSLEIKLNRIG